MYRFIAFVCLLVTANGQNNGGNPNSSGDLESLTSSIFRQLSTGTGNTGTVTQSPIADKNNGPSTLVPGVPATNSPSDLSCRTPDNQAGECIPYYLCNNNNNTVILDGVGVIDINGGGPCVSYLHTCCLVSVQRPPDIPLKPLVREGCGWRNVDGVGFRITGDKDGETKFGEFPWICAILKIDPINDIEVDGQKMSKYISGGSLIHPSVVLTAAHFVATEKELRVRAGEWDTRSTTEIYPYQERVVSGIEIHKDFNKGKLFYDVAVLFLKTPMDLAPNVGLACLPPPREQTPAGTRCFASGWGREKFNKVDSYRVILKKVEIAVVDRDTCQAQLRKTRLGKLFMLHSSFMCAGGEAGKDTCIGDGGSPLACPIETEKDRYMQSGIVAWGIGCGANNVPGVYVDVANLRAWIDDKVAGKGYDPKTYSYLS